MKNLVRWHRHRQHMFGIFHSAGRCWVFVVESYVWNRSVKSDKQTVEIAKTSKNDSLERSSLLIFYIYIYTFYFDSQEAISGGFFSNFNWLTWDVSRVQVLLLPALLKESHRMGFFDGKFQPPDIGARIRLEGRTLTKVMNIDEAKFAGINPWNTINTYSNGIFCVCIILVLQNIVSGQFAARGLGLKRVIFLKQTRESHRWNSSSQPPYRPSKLPWLPSCCHGPCTASMRRWVGHWVQWRLPCLKSRWLGAAMFTETTRTRGEMDCNHRSIQTGKSWDVHFVACVFPSFRVYSTVGLLAPQEGPGRGGSIMSLEEVHEEQWYKMGMRIACGSHWVGAIVGSTFFHVFSYLEEFHRCLVFCSHCFSTLLFPGRNEHYNSNSRFQEQQTIQHVLKFRGSLNLNEWFILTAANFPIHHSRARSCLGLLDSCWSSSLF